ncbi:MAG: hypothetical protein AAFQ88_14115 [Pseudomonadota bacterium]
MTLGVEEREDDPFLVATADLAASMLAIGIMLLAIVLAHRITTTPAEPQAEVSETRTVPVEAASALNLAVGAPLSAELSLRAMRLRAADPPLMPVLDVLGGGQGLRAGAPGRAIAPLQGPAEEATRRFLASLPPGDPVVLFVFDHADYAPVRRAVNATGRDWVEFSPPEALRSGDGSDWTGAFDDLERAAESSEARFRGAFTDLLKQQASEEAEETAEEESLTRPDLLARLTRWFERILAAIALIGVTWVTLSHERRRIFDCNGD